MPSSYDSGVKDNQSANTYYYPSSAGQAVAFDSGLAIQFQSSGGVTVTVEGTVDGTNWADISEAMYDAVTDATGVASWVDVNKLLSLSLADTPIDKWRVKCVLSDGSNSLRVAAKSR